MAAAAYNVVYQGKSGLELKQQQVAENLCRLFKLSPEKVRDTFFARSTVVVKKNVDYETAEKYRTALKKAGMLTTIEPADSKPVPDTCRKKDALPQKTARPAPDAKETALSPCPKCGYQPKSPQDPLLTNMECPACGVIVSKYLEAAAQKAEMESPEADCLRERVLSVLEKVAAADGVYVYPDLPANKIENAIQTSKIPPYEEILGLVDCTVFGSAKDCMVFGIKGIYFHNPGSTLPEQGMVPYEDLSRQSIQVLKNNTIDLGEDRCFNCSGSLYTVHNLCALLQALQPVLLEVLFGETIPADVEETGGDTPASLPPAETKPLKDGIREILKNALPQDGLHVAPDIPGKKYRNAIEACNILPTTLMLGLVDCTVMGSAKNAMVFCEDGIYFHNGFETTPKQGRVPYTEFKERQFRAVDKHTVNLGNNDNVGIAGCPCSASKIMGVLDAVRGLVTGETQHKKTPIDSLLSPRCPKCGSTEFEIGESGYSWGTGIATTIFFGPLAGHLAASAQEGKTVFTCNACSKSWKPSKEDLNNMLLMVKGG